MLPDHLVSAAYKIDWKFKTTHAVTFPKSYYSGYHRLRHFEHLNRSRGYDLFFFFCHLSKREYLSTRFHFFMTRSRVSIIFVCYGISRCPWSLFPPETKHNTTPQHTTQYTLCINGINPLLLTFSYCSPCSWRGVLFCFLLFFPLSLEPTTCIIILYYDLILWSLLSQ